ncbi:hypothetical protein UlMin_040183 [Ulmus minor]
MDSKRWRPSWPLRKAVVAITVLVAIAVVVAVAFSILSTIGRRTILSKVPDNRNDCDFPAIFNFGDSNSDTGGLSAAFNRLPFPYGETFFHKPSGRFSDGKVIVDFIAEKLGLPFVSAYLDSIGTNFRHGANFATGGSTIEEVDGNIFGAGFSPISLKIQLSQFKQFKARTEELFNEGSHTATNLPRPEDFSKALYTLDIGQNDLHYVLKFMTEEQLKASISNIISVFVQAMKDLYQLGARAFWIHNTGPVGCLPYSVVYFPQKIDQNGCVKAYNEVAMEFNKQLSDSISELRIQLSNAVLTYVDIYSAKYSLISEAKKHGFVDPFGYCYGEKTRGNASESSGAACSDPSVYISWDGVHYTHAANKWVASQILDGSLSDPPIPITQACLKHVLS